MSDDDILAAGALGDAGAVLNRQVDACGVRKVVVPSPGSRTSHAVVRDGANADRSIGYMRNSGRCKLYLNALDSNGEILIRNDRGEQVMLTPGQILEGWVPPAGTVKVVVAAGSSCTDYAELEWDPCAYYA